LGELTAGFKGLFGFEVLVNDQVAKELVFDGPDNARNDKQKDTGKDD